MQVNYVHGSHIWLVHWHKAMFAFFVTSHSSHPVWLGPSLQDIFIQELINCFAWLQSLEGNMSLQQWQWTCFSEIYIGVLTFLKFLNGSGVQKHINNCEGDNWSKCEFQLIFLHLQEAKCSYKVIQLFSYSIEGDISVGKNWYAFKWSLQSFQGHFRFLWFGPKQGNCQI